MKVLTIVIPAFNAEKYLEDTLESIYNQVTDFEYDVFVSDDCSIDATKNMCEKYSKNNSNFSFYTQEVNIGMSKNAEYVLKFSKTEFTAFIDSDDVYLDIYYLQKQVDYLKSDPQLSMVFSNVKRFNSDNRVETILYSDFKPPRKFDVNQYIKNEAIKITNSAMVVRNSISQQIPSVFFNFFQFDFLCHLYRGLHGEYGYNDFVGVGYRVHKNQATNVKNSEKKLRDAILLCYKMKELFPEKISRYFTVPQYELNQLSFFYLYKRRFIKFIAFYVKWLCADKFKNFNLRDQFWRFRRAILKKDFS
jgi:glycosyltransferase involved in cell wall biosynthesis